jgi:hypothetical protein
MATQYTAGLTTGQVLTAAIMNQIGAAWETYTPVLDWSGGGGSLGNATISGRYARIQKIVVGHIYFKAGSTTTYGTGNIRFTLPITGSGTATNAYAPIGFGYLIDANVTTAYTIVGDRKNTADKIGGRVSAGNFGDVTNTQPFTWTTNDEFLMEFMYEAE